MKEKSVSKESYKLLIQKGQVSTEEKWTWYGELSKAGYKILRNIDQYTTDTFLLLDNQNIIGGYDYLVNNATTLRVTKL